MEIRQLMSVVAVADCRCFGKAAAQLNISQPALSISVKNLEREVGAEIFVRGRKDVVPTEFGTEFLVRARSALREIEKTRDLIRSNQTNRTRIVSMGIDGLLSGPVIVRVTPRFSEAFPDVKFEVDVATGPIQDALIRISSGQWDFGVVLAHDGTSIPKGVSATVCARLTTLPHARRQHPLASRPHVTLADLAAQRWVLSTRVAHTALVAACTKVGLKRPTIAARTNSFDAIKGLIESTDWVTFLPTEIVTRHYRETFAKLPNDDLKFRTNVLLVHSRDVELTLPCRTLIDQVREALDN